MLHNSQVGPHAIGNHKFDSLATWRIVEESFLPDCIGIHRVISLFSRSGLNMKVLQEDSQFMSRILAKSDMLGFLLKLKVDVTHLQPTVIAISRILSFYRPNRA